MADKTKTIKNASDKELDDLLNRLRKETNAQQLVRDLKRMSTTRSPYATYEDRENELAVSTEQPIESLYHFGVRGMKWGVRRSPAQLSKPSGGKTKTEDSADHITAKTLKKKKMRQMSNAELKELNNRLQLEKQYKDLNKKQVSRGQKVVVGLLENVGTEIAKSYIRDGVKTGLDYLKKETKR